MQTEEECKGIISSEPSPKNFEILNEQSFAKHAAESINESLGVINTEDLDSKPIPAVPSTKLNKKDKEENEKKENDVTLRELWTEIV